jgi:predicted XRE-type DNA-binding protein
MKKTAPSAPARRSFRDHVTGDAAANRIKVGLAQQIIRVLDEKSLTVRSAAEITGTSAADFSRIRQTKLARFTVDRLLNILNRLGQDVEFAVSVRPRPIRSKLVPR